jgi:hypothetical protein
MSGNLQPKPNRLVLAAVVLGLLFGVGLLVRQVWDYLADAGQPVLRQADLTSALGSIAMIAIFGLIGYNAARKAKR